MKDPDAILPERALERLAALCARAEYCEDDIRRKLNAMLMPDNDSDRIVAALRRDGYIDDARYCRAFANEKWELNHWGKTRIRTELRYRHLMEDDIDHALAEIDMEEYRKELGKLLRAKVRTIKAESLQERYQKLLRYAASRGFEPEVTRDVIEADPEL
jgi:regulatory protein